ncbi:DEAD/DEAH box helicase [Microbacterium sp.]|uniref:DEAD/DEAH box helicase n=1 Tax=Microbacterium sp. TaxID=51671 RepID=UPI003C1326E3
MERSLDVQLLRDALAGRSGLPSAERLQELLAQAEIALILDRPFIDDKLLKTAWYLHGVASVSDARQRYTRARQRQAFLVSAHIFDLTLERGDWSVEDRLSIGFAAAIGYRRGGRDPNAAAIVKRLRPLMEETDSAPAPALEHLSVRVGLVFLSFETRSAFRWFAQWRRYFASLAQQSEMADLRSTGLGALQTLVLAAEDILSFLARGDYELFRRGTGRLLDVATGETGGASLDARWVATHLLNFAGVAEGGSPWNPAILPPDVPVAVRQAFAVGSPSVLTLWEPQRELLTGEQSPFSASTKRMVLSVPTSGGKTLIAQFLAVAHLAQTNTSVCFVVPTRSLGREIRRAMATRVRILQKDVGAEKPDFPLWLDEFGLSTPVMEEAEIEVMTPERLSHLLRHDTEGVLERFGLFIFDEAQLTKETGRGFVLESVIAALNLHTKDRAHRIVLVSAAMGNVGGIAQWLSPSDNALVQQSDWRGPRRLHAVFNTEAEWDRTTVTSVQGRVWPYRHTTPLTGLIRLRLGNGSTKSLRTQGDTGWRLVRKSKEESQYSAEMPVDSVRNTKHYAIASDMITALGHAGSVLIVASTKKQAQTLAQGIADTLTDEPRLLPLVDFVRQQLGDAHPLVTTLRRGVGFHHAGLPVEVLEALEAAVRDDTLPYLTCTSTLTDGVNLPVRTVVLYDTPYPGQPDDTRLRGARLVNAMGRAGRAGRETEGWIVLVRAAPASTQDFADLNPDEEDLAVTSSLLTDAALHSVAELEASLRTGADAVFSADGAAADFVSFVWMMLANAEQQGIDPELVDLAATVDSTLAATQSPPARRVYLRLAVRTREAYASVGSLERRRWSRIGCSIGSARRIDEWAVGLARDLMQHGRATSAVTALEAVSFLQPTIVKLLQLPEAPRWRFRVSVQGAELDVEAVAVLYGWLTGASLPELADTNLGSVQDPAWRIEQMVTATTEQFEHYLSWTIGSLVELINGHLQTSDVEERICPELGGYIRYGVHNPTALLLMTEGIRSRRIANLVAIRMGGAAVDRDALREELSSMAVAGWREEFEASTSEVLDLLDFTRQRRRSLLKDLLDRGVAYVTLEVQHEADGSVPLHLAAVRLEADPAPIGVFEGTQLLATISPRDHSDIQAILDTGFALRTKLVTSDGLERLEMTLLDSADDVLF